MGGEVERGIDRAEIDHPDHHRDDDLVLRGLAVFAGLQCAFHPGEILPGHFGLQRIAGGDRLGFGQLAQILVQHGEQDAIFAGAFGIVWHRGGDAGDRRSGGGGGALGEDLFAAAAGKAGHERGSFRRVRSEEHTSELQSLMRISYAVFCLKKKNKPTTTSNSICATKYNSYTTTLTVLTVAEYD